MTRPRNYQTEAIIIRKTRLREADHILTLYTPNLGKIQGVARGVRRPKSKLAGHLEMLTHSQVSLARGRNLDTITGSQTINGFLLLKTDLWLTSYGLYLIEMVNQFTPEHVENHDLFQLLLDTMHNLCQDVDRELTLRYFELKLLHEVGYRPQLQQCVACHQPLEPVTNYFSPSAGGVLCPDCRQTQSFTYPISVNALKVLRLLQNSDYDTVNRLKLNAQLSRELETIMRSYLKHLLERDLKSAGWLDTLREQKAQT
ncbi:MAG: DNA repair protein RecO [Dehalococcoidales bacterium]|nr:DNA repair protein RecO [Dehalococcoidales bacterium]